MFTGSLEKTRPAEFGPRPGRDPRGSGPDKDRRAVPGLQTSKLWGRISKLAHTMASDRKTWFAGSVTGAKFL